MVNSLNILLMFKLFLPGNKRKRRPRPKRPCPFCGIMRLRIRDHCVAKHKGEQQVIHAESLPKDLRDLAYKQLRKEGIFKANAEILKDKVVDVSKLHRERNQGQPSSLKMCSECKGFFRSDLIHRHKKHCPAAEGSTTTPSSVSLWTLMPDTDYSQLYRTDILESFRESDYGTLIRSDDWIKTYGYILYQNIEGSVKRIEKRFSLTSKLRRLAHLFLEFKKTAGKSCFADSLDSCSKMFDRRNIPLLQQAISNLTQDKETKKVKNGLKLSLRYLINDVCLVMQANYYIKMEDDKAEELAKFMTILKIIFPSFFQEAEESVVTKRQAELRAPLKLPPKENIIRLRDCTKDIIRELTADKFSLYTTNEFCRLRDALVCRLTLFNARRGGEPSRMRLSELSDAMTDKWIDQHQAEHFIEDEIEKSLLFESKVAYIRASKLAKLVPVIIPDDCWKALNMI